MVAIVQKIFEFAGFTNVCAFHETLSHAMAEFGVRVPTAASGQSLTEEDLHSQTVQMDAAQFVRPQSEEDLHAKLELGKVYPFIITFFEPKERRMTLKPAV